jgi:hypothetical protein
MQRRNASTPAPQRAGGGGSSSAVRHAEKRRSGSCLLANRIAWASLRAYDDAVPASYRDAHRSGTCVAAIVAHFRGGNDDDGEVGTEEAEADDDDDDDDDGGECDGTAADDRPSRRRRGGCRLQVMGLGVGTKFLPRAILREEEGEGGEREGREDGGPSSSPSSSSGGGGGRRGGRGRRYGGRVRDCHAEVLARRAFRRQISMEMAADAACGGGCGGVVGGDGYVPILERAVADRRRCDYDVGGGNDSGGEQRVVDHHRRYRLRDGVTLHFYASSAPCEW